MMDRLLKVAAVAGFILFVTVGIILMVSDRAAAADRKRFDARVAAQSRLIDEALDRERAGQTAYLDLHLRRDRPPTGEEWAQLYALRAESERQMAEGDRLAAFKPAVARPPLPPGYLPPAMVAALLPSVAWIIRSELQKHRQAQWAGNNRCVQCGYDLRESPGRCPECGTVPAAERI